LDHGQLGILGSGCHSCRRELITKVGCMSLNAAFCRLVCLQLPSSQIDMAEACGSRTRTIDSQLTANDDVAASARFQLESIGVRTLHFPAKLLPHPQQIASLLSLGPCFSDCGLVDLCRRLAGQVLQLSDVGWIPIARSISLDDSVAFMRLSR
jgi:hypothetical protein